VDFGAIASLLELLAEAVGASAGLVAGIHDVSDGGIAVCLAELAARSGLGLEVGGGAVSDTDVLFSELPGRVVVCTTGEDRLKELAARYGVSAELIGRAGGERVVIGGLIDVSLEEITKPWAGSLPSALGEPLPAAAGA
jgi:phosphoribosylformylglycinamidine synthase subunit PurL